MCVCECVIKGGGGLQVARSGVLPRKQNTLGWGGINESGRGEGSGGGVQQGREKQSGGDLI